MKCRSCVCDRKIEKRNRLFFCVFCIFVLCRSKLLRAGKKGLCYNISKPKRPPAGGAPLRSACRERLKILGLQMRRDVFADGEGNCGSAGQPRRGGNTEQMADAFIRGAEKAGHRAVKIYAADRKADCVACGGCYSSEDRPCCRNADFNEIAPVLLRADGIVFATPLYWYDFPGKLKCLIDNMYCFLCSG